MFKISIFHIILHIRDYYKEARSNFIHILLSLNQNLHYRFSLECLPSSFPFFFSIHFRNDFLKSHPILYQNQ